MDQPLLPVLYHAHHTRQNEDLSFYLALASQVGGPILELGCGTGRLMEPLAEAGYPVFGLDLDFRMLAYLRRRMNSEENRRMPVFQADMSSFCLGRSFPLILLPCNTYSTLLPEVRRKTLEQVRRHLAPAGIFAVSLPNPVILRDLEMEAEAEIEDEFSLPSGEDVQVSSAWRKGVGQVIIEWHYDLLSQQGEVERHTMDATHFLTSFDTYREELIQSGFIVRSVLGDYDFSPYSLDSPYLIFLLTR